MKKKIISLIVCGIFFITILSPIYTCDEIIFVKDIKQKNDFLMEVKEELAIKAFYIIFVYGDFIIENNSVIGHGFLFIGMIFVYGFIPVPVIARNHDVNYPLTNWVHFIINTNSILLWYGWLETL